MRSDAPGRARRGTAPARRTGPVDDDRRLAAAQGASSSVSSRRIEDRRAGRAGRASGPAGPIDAPDGVEVVGVEPGAAGSSRAGPRRRSSWWTTYSRVLASTSTGRSANGVSPGSRDLGDQRGEVLAAGARHRPVGQPRQRRHDDAEAGQRAVLAHEEVGEQRRARPSRRTAWGVGPELEGEVAQVVALAAGEGRAHGASLGRPAHASGPARPRPGLTSSALRSLTQQPTRRMSRLSAPGIACRSDRLPPGRPPAQSGEP